MHDTSWKEIAPTLKEARNAVVFVFFGQTHTAFNEELYPHAKEGKRVHETPLSKALTIVPRVFYFIEYEPNENSTDDKRHVYSHKAQVKRAKDTLEDEIGRVYRTPSIFFAPPLLKISSLLRFGSTKEVVLPIQEAKKVENVGWRARNIPPNAFYKGNADKRGFRNSEVVCPSRDGMGKQDKTEKEEKDIRRRCLTIAIALTNQPLHKPLLVMYNKSGKDANAVLLKRKDLKERTFITDYTSPYAYYTDNEAEAYYLLACLNANASNLEIKDLFKQDRLIGPRHIVKKILAVAFSAL